MDEALKEDLFIQADKAWDAGDLRRAFRLFLKSARLGDADSQNNLGYFYKYGIGTRADNKKAMYWYKRAGRSGSSIAFNNIGILYRDLGKMRQARYWLEKAVRVPDGDAALQLAKTYLMSRRPNIVLARKYLEIAIRSEYIIESSLEEAEQLLKEMNEKEKTGK